MPPQTPSKPLTETAEKDDSYLDFQEFLEAENSEFLSAQSDAVLGDEFGENSPNYSFFSREFEQLIDLPFASQGKIISALIHKMCEKKPQKMPKKPIVLNQTEIYAVNVLLGQVKQNREFSKNRLKKVKKAALLRAIKTPKNRQEKQLKTTQK